MAQARFGMLAHHPSAISRWVPAHAQLGAPAAQGCSSGFWGSLQRCCATRPPSGCRAGSASPGGGDLGRTAPSRAVPPTSRCRSALPEPLPAAHAPWAGRRSGIRARRQGREKERARRQRSGPAAAGAGLAAPGCSRRRVLPARFRRLRGGGRAAGPPFPSPRGGRSARRALPPSLHPSSIPPSLPAAAPEPLARPARP